jgi:hypothetical protein
MAPGNIASSLGPLPGDCRPGPRAPARAADDPRPRPRPPAERPSPREEHPGTRRAPPARGRARRSRIVAASVAAGPRRAPRCCQCGSSTGAVDPPGSSRRVRHRSCTAARARTPVPRWPWRRSYARPPPPGPGATRVFGSQRIPTPYNRGDAGPFPPPTVLRPPRSPFAEHSAGGRRDAGPGASPKQPMAKQMVFEADAREAIRRGVEKLSKAVTSTLGPRGRNAVLDKGWGAPTITKDGVTWPRRSSSPTPTRISAPSWSRKSPARPATSPATARRPPPC